MAKRRTRKSKTAGKAASSKAGGGEVDHFPDDGKKVTGANGGGRGSKKATRKKVAKRKKSTRKKATKRKSTTKKGKQSARSTPEPESTNQKTDAGSGAKADQGSDAAAQDGQTTTESSTQQSSHSGGQRANKNGRSSGQKRNGGSADCGDTGNEKKICQIVIWMTQGHVYSNLPSLCSEKLGVEVEEAQTLIKEARRRVTRASYTNRDLELGTAINRCNKIYLDNLHDKPHVAMTAQKELNKLLKLYDQPVREGDEDDPDQEVSESSAELEAIGDHLLPLGLAPEDYPLSEHARIAAERIRNQDD